MIEPVWEMEFPTKVEFYYEKKSSLESLDKEIDLSNIFIGVATHLHKYGVEGQLVVGHGKALSENQLDQLCSILEKNGLKVQCLKGVGPGAASLDQISEWVQEVNKNKPLWVLAVGGGGVIDTAKILAFSAGLEVIQAKELSYEYLAEAVFKEESVPVIAIPTCLGSGAEVSDLAEIFLKEDKVKKPLIGKKLAPKLAIIAPLLCMGVPMQIQAAAIVDVMVHLLDPLFSIGEGESWPQVEESIRLARRIVHLSREMFCEPLNLKTLTEIAWISHMAVKPGLGRVPCPSVIHRIEHVFSPHIGVTHGEGLALLTPAFIEELEISRNSVWCKAAAMLTEVFECKDRPERLIRMWLRELPLSLPSIDVSKVDVRRITQQITASFGVNKYLPGTLGLSTKEIARVVLNAVRDKKPKTQKTEMVETVINAKRVFGKSIRGKWDLVILTPLKKAFEIMCDLNNVKAHKGWIMSANMNKGNKRVLILHPNPGGANGMDTLYFSQLAGAKFNHLVFLGFGGALDETWEEGLRVLSYYATQNIDLVKSIKTKSKVAPDWCSSAKWPIRQGVVFSVDMLNQESMGLLDLLYGIGFNIVDMETGPIAMWCSRNGVTLEAVLVVSDHPRSGHPLWSKEFVSEKAEISMRHLANDLSNWIGMSND